MERFEILARTADAGIVAYGVHAEATATGSALLGVTRRDLAVVCNPQLWWARVVFDLAQTGG